MKKLFASFGLVVMLGLLLSTTASAATTTTMQVSVRSDYNMVRSKEGTFPIGHAFYVTTETTGGVRIPWATVKATLTYADGSVQVIQLMTNATGQTGVAGPYSLTSLCIKSVTKAGYSWAGQDIPYCTLWAP